MDRHLAIRQALEALKYCQHKPSLHAHALRNQEAYDVLEIMLEQLPDSPRESDGGAEEYL